MKIHFKRRDANCSFPHSPPGADLRIDFSNGEPALSIEIKGTASPELRWQQLKASSETSWKMLSEGLPVYRVCDVFDERPTIYILRYGVDFTLEPEPRWAFKRIGPRGTPRRKERREDSDRPAATAPASRASKYDSLRQYLQSHTADEVTLRFSEAERVLGFALPKSAFTHQAYWANQSDTRNRPWARAWSDAGFEVDGHRLSDKDGWVRFKRRRT